VVIVVILRMRFVSCLLVFFSSVADLFLCILVGVVVIMVGVG